MSELAAPPVGVALHAEVVPDDPTAMRWVLPDGLPASGRLLGAPGVLGELLAGLIVRAVAEPAALWTWLAEPSWPEHGPVVRDAIIAAAARPDQWQVAPAADEVLQLVAKDVIDHQLGTFIASHGGRIALVRVETGVVEVEMAGACAHCPAAGLTLQGRIGAAITARLGQPVEVRPAGGVPAGAAKWRRLLRRA